MIKAVLFDLDGTVINTNELVIASWKHALSIHLDMCPEDSEIVGTFGEPLITTARRYDKDNADSICSTYRKFNMVIHDEMIKGYDGMDEAIRSLKGLGMKVGIVTSKRRETALRALKMFNLLQFMDVVITMDDTEKHKPDPEPLIKALEAIEVPPEDAMYVGDSHYDILCGKNAGCSTCAVKYSAIPFEELMKYNPDYAVDRPLDIVDIVRESVSAKNAV